MKYNLNCCYGSNNVAYHSNEALIIVNLTLNTYKYQIKSSLVVFVNQKS